MLHQFYRISIFWLTLLTAGSALAQDDNALTLSDSEKVVCSFLKLSNKDADIDAWITNSERYKKANKFDRRDIMREDKERLPKACDSYNRETDLIRITDEVRASTTVKDGKRILEIKFTDREKNENLFYSYTYGPDAIALILKAFQNHRVNTLEPEQIPIIKKYFHDGAPYETEIELRVKAVTADDSSKIQVEGKDQWLMLGDIAYIKVDYRDKFLYKMVTVWDYNAPWYFNESQRTLLDVFRHPTP